MVFPFETPKIVPVSPLPEIVAKPDKSVIHGLAPDAVIDPVREILLPIQTSLAPVIVGNALTEILLVVLQPFPFV
jgi:hypothetical protein